MDVENVPTLVAYAMGAADLSGCGVSGPLRWKRRGENIQIWSILNSFDLLSAQPPTPAGNEMQLDKSWRS
jgi:hypothetical protein